MLFFASRQWHDGTCHTQNGFNDSSNMAIVLQMFEKQLNLKKWKFFSDDCLIHAVSLERLQFVFLKNLELHIFSFDPRTCSEILCPPFD